MNNNLAEEGEQAPVLLEEPLYAAHWVQLGGGRGFKQQVPVQPAAPLHRPHVDLQLVVGERAVLSELAHAQVPGLQELWTTQNTFPQECTIKETWCKLLRNKSNVSISCRCF